MLSRVESDEELEAEAGWVASMVECWLNEEWPAQELLQVHADLAATTGQAYLRLRREEGVQEMGDMVLSLSTELMTSFDFHPTFSSAFEVANKVVELLMLRSGCDVCCTTDADRSAISRYEAQLGGKQ
ncbi:hypothetical protein ABPG75_007480 [Micractinium tetrahymenae]